MKNISRKIRQFLFGNVFQVAITFLISGLLAGALFTWLTYLPALEAFFFIPDRKVTRIALFSWYVAFGLVFAFGLVAAFLVSSQRSEFVLKFRVTKLRSFLVFALVAGTMPFSYGLFRAAFPLIDGSLLLILPVLFLALFSAAMCVMTRSLRLLPVAFLTSLFYTFVALCVVALTFPLVRTQSNYITEFVQWTALFSLLSLGFGLWLSVRRFRSTSSQALCCSTDTSSRMRRN